MRFALATLLLPLAACQPADPSTAPADSLTAQTAPSGVNGATGEVVPGVSIGTAAVGMAYDSVAVHMGVPALDAAGPGEMLTAWRRPSAGSASGDSSGWIAVFAVADTAGGTGYHVRMVRASPDALRPGGVRRSDVALLYPQAVPFGSAHLYAPGAGVGLTFDSASDTARATSVFVVARGTTVPAPLDPIASLFLPGGGGR